MGDSPMTGLFAMLDLGLEVMKILAVLGGATFGWLGSSAGLRVAGRAVGKKQLPSAPTKVAQSISGTALGILVGLWVYGTGGGGFGWGPGTGSGKGEGTGTGAGIAATSPEVVSKTEAPPTTAKTVEETAPLPLTIRVRMLGGSEVRDNRFYLVDEGPTPMNLADVKALIRDKGQSPGAPPLKGLEIVVTEESVAQDHPAVRDLERWARENRLNVTLTFPKPSVP